MFKRLLALLMSLVLVFSLLPVSVFAEEDPGEGIVTEEETAPADPVVEEPAIQEEVLEEPETIIPEEISEEPESFDAAPEEPSEEPEEPEQEVLHYYVPFQVNPLYEGLVTYDDIPEPEEPIALYSEPVYGTVAEAKAVVREALKNRVENVSVYVVVKDFDFDALFREILYGAMEHTGNPAEGDYLLYQYGGSSGSGNVKEDSDNNHYVTVIYTLRYYNTLEQEEEMDVAVRALLNQLNLYGKSDYEKINGIYEWMCKNIYYDYTNLNVSSYKLKYTAYAALVNKTAVCQGYANLFYRLALELGVDSRIISGEGITSDGSGGHAWNIVGLDGLYYDLDATWDATYVQYYMQYGYPLEYQWFLKNEAEFSQDHVREAEFTTAAFHAAYPMATADYVYVAPSYVAQGNCGNNLTWTLDSEGVLTVSGTGEMTKFAAAKNAPWYDYLDSVKKVVIENGVTTVSNNAFRGYTGLTDVKIGNSVVSIGSNTFYGCSELSNLQLGSAIESIGPWAFHSCTSLTAVEIPDGVTSIGNSAFSYCFNLSSVEIPDSVTTIGEEAFYGSLCLTSVEIPDSVTSIGKYAFAGCTALEEIVVDGNNTAYSSDEYGVLFNKGKTTLICCPAGKTGAYAVPDSVTGISSSAFLKCTGLTSVQIGKSVASIGDSAFEYCSGLKEITFTGVAPSFATSIFYGVTAKVNYPAGDESWTEDVRKGYSGTLTWEAYCDPAHDSVDDVCAYCGTVKISEITFPDANFRAYVETLDGAEDGLLTTAELSGVTSINVSNKNIGSLTGIEYFTALTELNCSDNELMSLDVSGCTALVQLDCLNNQLTSLDVSSNAALKYLSCSRNQLTSLDVSQNTTLINLECSSNQLTSLDVSQNTSLTALWCSHNQLTSLDVSQNTALSYLFCNMSSRTVSVEQNKFDLSVLAADGFDISKASDWVGGTVSGNILTATAETVTYTYDLGNGETATFTLDLEGFCAHSIVEVHAVEPTMDAEGNIAHFACETCGKLFADAEGETELAPEDVILEKVVAMASINGVSYPTVAAALAAVQEGDTVTLMDDAQAGTLIVPVGVTLDLGDHDLTVDYLVVFNGGYVIANVNSGRLIAPKGRIILGEQGYVNAAGQYIMPIWDPVNECYQFSLFVVNTDSSKGRGLKIDEEKEEIYFQFKHQASGFAITDLLADGASDNEMSVIIRLEWSNEKGSASQAFVYNDTQVGYVSVGKNGVAQDYTFTLTGYSALNIDLSTLKVTAVIVTNSNSVASGMTWTQETAK